MSAAERSPRRLSRGFLIAASAYRRQVRERSGLDFSRAALLDQYAHETHGAPKPDERVNGYTLGKWTLDVTLDAMFEDFMLGLFTKHELMRGSCAFVRRQISNWPTVTYQVRSTGNP